MKPSPVDLAYMAGLFDGEGSLFLKKNRDSLILCMTIEMTEREGLEVFTEVFGGKILPHTRPDKIHPIYRWEVTNASVEEPLRLLLPYLKVKQPQGVRVLEFLEWRAPFKHGKRQSKEEKDIAEWFRGELKRLKIPGQGLLFEKIPSAVRIGSWSEGGKSNGREKDN